MDFRKVSESLLGPVLKGQEKIQLLNGRILSRDVRRMPVGTPLRETEFSVFSQWGDDGIIQFLTHHVKVANDRFVEFGVEDYRESNTRFLLMNDGWTGFIMDGSAAAMESVRTSEGYWRHSLQANAAFITAENIEALLAEAKIPDEIGLLHIDIDGMDYWVWKAIQRVRASIVIVEYNSVFGAERPITIPYRSDFNRTEAHFSNLYWGTSLGALGALAKEKAYAFVGCNSAGNNAYFVQRERLGGLRELSLAEGFVTSKYRESRDAQGKLTYLAGDARREAIKGLPVWNVRENREETL